MSATDQSFSLIADELAAPSERSVVMFVSVQLFVLIYFQKFIAIGGATFALPVPLVVLLIGTTGMIMLSGLEVAVPRLLAYLSFVTFCLLSECMRPGSFPSILELFLLYICMIIIAPMSDAGFIQVIKRFNRFLILPACIIIIQYVYQRLTGLSDPISMTPYLPKSLLVQGFYYEAHWPWNSPFMRPNGLFFLEPSFASAFTATAVILEVTFFRRPLYIVLMVLATGLSTGATGMLMLVFAAPFLLAREDARLCILFVVAAIVVLAVLYLFDIPVPLVARADELDASGSSGSGRVTLPAEMLVQFMFDPAFFVTGYGAGASSAWLDGSLSMWPMVKLVSEYGLIAMVSFVTLYVMGIAGRRPSNVPLKISLSIIYLFTGGYLLSPVLPELIILLCFMPTCREPANFAVNPLSA